MFIIPCILGVFFFLHHMYEQLPMQTDSFKATLEAAVCDESYQIENLINLMTLSKHPSGT